MKRPPQLSRQNPAQGDPGEKGQFEETHRASAEGRLAIGDIGEVGEERRTSRSCAHTFHTAAQEEDRRPAGHAEQLRGRRPEQRAASHQPSRSYCVRQHAQRQRRQQFRAKGNGAEQTYDLVVGPVASVDEAKKLCQELAMKATPCADEKLVARRPAIAARSAVLKA